MSRHALVTDYFAYPPVDLDAALDAHGAFDFFETSKAREGVPVQLAELVPTQWHIDTVYLRAVARSRHDGGLAVIRMGGKLYLADGHHHAAALLAAGERVALSDEYRDFDASGGEGR